MSTFCEIVLYLGLTWGGCIPEKPPDTSLPQGDKGVTTFQEPAKKAPPAEKLQSFPAVVIQYEGTPPDDRQTTEKKPAKKEEKPTEKAPPKASPAPDPIALALRAALASRSRTFNDLQPTAVSFEAKSAGQKGMEAGVSFQAPQAGAESLHVPPLHPTAGTNKKRKKPGYKAPKKKSSFPVDNSRILAADRYISGILETGINSQLSSKDGGTAIIQVSRDVFGYHGRNILIPRGSRLICDYEGAQKVGFTRIALDCKRILLGGSRAEIWQLASVAGDSQAHAGITGAVDNRWFEKYGTAMIMSLVSASVQAAASLADNPSGNEGGTSASAAQEAAANLSERFGEITAQVLEQNINLKPIITIAQGARVQIRPRNDWYIPAPGEEPVIETAENKEGQDS